MRNFRALAYTNALVCLAIAGSATIANAGDLPRRTSANTYAPASAEPAKSWQGCHGGAHLGAGYGSASRLNTSGALIGAQVGCDIQSDRFVAGVEGDASYTGMNNTGYGGKYRQKWIGSARVRAGYAIDDRLLAYGTAGLAAGSGQFKALGVSTDKTHTGWVAGVGVQYKVTNNVSVRGELLHYDLGRQNYATGLGTVKLRSTDNVARVGADYHF